MTNTPFRVAFWTLCCAFLLSLALVASNPDAGQVALSLMHPARSPTPAGDAPSEPLPRIVLGLEGELRVPEFAADQRTVPDPYGEPWSGRVTVAEQAPRSEAGETVWPAEYSPSASSGVRTASADPVLAFGLVESPPVPQKWSLNNSHPEQEPVTTPSIQVTPEAGETGASILVPHPGMETVSVGNGLVQQVFPEPEMDQLHSRITQLKVAQLSRQLLEARSQERGKLQQIAESELSAIAARLQEFQDRVTATFHGSFDSNREAPAPPSTALALGETDAAPFTPGLGTAAVPASAPEQAGDRGRIQITQSETADRFDLTIADADVRDVLQSLGRHLNRRIIVASDVTGRFSGEFEAADLEQIFVMVIKAHRLRIDRRGDYMLIGRRE